MNKIKELRQKRAGLFEQAKAILAKGDTMSAEDQGQYEALMGEIDALKAQIDRLERAEQLEAEMAASLDQRAEVNGVSGDEQADQEQRVSRAFSNYLRMGLSDMSAEDREIMAARRRDFQNAQSTTTTAGGYLVPEGFYGTLMDAMLAFGGMRRASDILTTATGNDLPIPTSNDTSNKGEIVSENSQQTHEQDITFGQVVLNSYLYSSKIIRVSIQLMQDSAFDLNTFLAKKMGERIGRITNDHFTTGTGSGQPNGIVTAATLGKTGASGQTTSIIYADLVDLLHSVDPSYRDMPGAGWMMPDAMLKTMRKLVDGESRPLWQPGLAVGAPDTILDKPYIINQSMASPAAGAKTLLFGDLKKYMIRDVLGVTVMRLTERYADYHQVGFLAFSRHDGDLLDAGTHPVKYYQHAAA